MWLSQFRFSSKTSPKNFGLLTWLTLRQIVIFKSDKRNGILSVFVFVFAYGKIYILFCQHLEIYS